MKDSPLPSLTLALPTVMVWLQDVRVAITPTLSHSDDVGFDLYLVGDHHLEPGERQDLPTGVHIAMPVEIYGRITGRSSSIRRGIQVFEGIIDPGYRGELLAYAMNITKETIHLNDGDRIAQLVFAPAIRPRLKQVSFMPPSDRGHKGLGSSGQ